MTFASRLAALALAAMVGWIVPASAQQAPPPNLPPPQRSPTPNTYGPDELVTAGHRFFGSISRGLAEAVESATRKWGRPNAYILGQEGAGAFVGGVRYGEGVMYTRNAGDRRVYWQGPSLGFDWGGDGARTMQRWASSRVRFRPRSPSAVKYIAQALG